MTVLLTVVTRVQGMSETEPSDKAMSETEPSDKDESSTSEETDTHTGSDGTITND